MTRPVTHVIMVNDGPGRPLVATETQLGHALSDAIREIWDEVYADPERVLAWNVGAGTSEDVTDRVATELAARTFREGETPEHVRAFCEPLGKDCFDEVRHAQLMRDPNAGLALDARQLGVGMGR